MSCDKIVLVKMNLSTLVRKIKKYASNPNISDEQFLNDFLLAYINAENIKNRNGDSFFFDKERTSLLLNQKIDVPNALRNQLNKMGVQEKTESNMVEFVEDYYDSDSLFDLYSFLNKTSNTKNIAHKDTVTIATVAHLLTKLLLQSLSEANTISESYETIWKNGNNTIDVIKDDILRFGFSNRKKHKNIIVIPVNSNFDTLLSNISEDSYNPLISENTLHGQWLIKMQKSIKNMQELNARIKESLRNLGYSPKSIDITRTGNPENYEIGTISIIENNNAIY